MVRPPGRGDEAPWRFAELSTRARCKPALVLQWRIVAAGPSPEPPDGGYSSTLSIAAGIFATDIRERAT